MRALIIAPSIIATPIAASAATGLVCIPATADPKWLALLAAERRTSEQFTITATAHDDAYGIFYDAVRVWEKEWQARKEALRLPHVEWIEGESAESREPRVTASIREYNRQAMALDREQKVGEERIRQECGLAGIEKEYAEASSRHRGAISAIIAHPSRDPAIIIAKMELLIREFGDESGDLGPLLASIVGGA
jgi:hypothetical protein